MSEGPGVVTFRPLALEDIRRVLDWRNLPEVASERMPWRDAVALDREATVTVPPVGGTGDRRA